MENKNDDLNRDEYINKDEITGKEKMKMLAGLIWSDLWGLVLMAAIVIGMNMIFHSATQLTGFMVGVMCGFIVWVILSTGKHWLYPVSYTVILFAYLITKRAVDVGIAGFYLNEWYCSTEIMLIIATVGTIILYKVIHKVEISGKERLFFKGVCIALALSVLFFTGVISSKDRNRDLLFGKASIMLIQQMFAMRDQINKILESENIDMKVAEEKLDFNFANTTILMEAFFPEKSPARRFDDYIRDEVKNFIFSYEEGVSEGKYAPGKSDRKRLEILRDFCSKLAGDINATYGDYRKNEILLSKIPATFNELINK